MDEKGDLISKDSVDTINLNFSYKQWYITNYIINYFNKFLSKGQHRELKAILERLFVCLCEIYSEDWQKYNEELFKIMEYEIANCKKLKGKIDKGEVSKLVKKAFNINVVTPDTNFIVYNNTFVYGKFSQHLNRCIIDRLKNYKPSEVMCMLLRMAAMCPQGQQWSIPTEWFKYICETYGNIDLIGFSSPQNVQIESAFCSIHPRDSIFGSIGNIFKIDFKRYLVKYKDNKFVCTMNPPFIVDILNQAVRIVHDIFEIGKILNIKIILFFNGPEWKDTMYYQTLIKSEYLKKDVCLAKSEHVYQDCHENNFIPANFESHLFALDNYNLFKDEQKIAYHNFTEGFKI